MVMVEGREVLEVSVAFEGGADGGHGFAECGGGFAADLEDLDVAFGADGGGARAFLEDGDFPEVAAAAEGGEGFQGVVFVFEDFDFAFLDDEEAVADIAFADDVLAVLEDEGCEVEGLVDAEVDEVAAEEGSHEPVPDDADFFLRRGEVEDHEEAPDEPCGDAR